MAPILSISLRHPAEFHDKQTYAANLPDKTQHLKKPNPLANCKIGKFFYFPMHSSACWQRLPTCLLFSRKKNRDRRPLYTTAVKEDDRGGEIKSARLLLLCFFLVGFQPTRPSPDGSGMTMTMTIARKDDFKKGGGKKGGGREATIWRPHARTFIAGGAIRRLFYEQNSLLSPMIKGRPRQTIIWN